MDDDRKDLIAALELAARTYRDTNPRRTLLSPTPGDSVLAPLAAAIEIRARPGDGRRDRSLQADARVLRRSEGVCGRGVDGVRVVKG